MSDAARFLLDPATLAAAVDAGTHARGLDVYRSQKVLDSELQGANRNEWFISGRVRGSGREVYDVGVDVHVNDQGAITHFEGDCSCPVGTDCKHAVALTIRAAYKSGGMLGARGSAKPVAANPLSVQDRERRQADSQLKQWLGLFGDETPQRPDATAHDAMALQIVFTLFAPPRGSTLEPRRLQLGWGLSRPLKTSKTGNEWIKVRRPGYGDDRAAPPEARQAIQLIRGLAMGERSAYGYYAGDGQHSVLVGELGQLALQHAARHGRLFYCTHTDTLGAPLRLGEPRVLDWRWEQTHESRLGEPVWRIVPQWPGASADSNASAQCFANDPPLYVDWVTGECGAIASPQLSPEHLRLLLTAPPIPQSAFSAHEATLLRRLAGLPLPPVLTPPEECRAAPVPTLLVAPVAPLDVSRLGLLTALLHFDYGSIAYFSRQSDSPVLVTPPGEPPRRVLLHRDLAAETAAQAALHALGLHGDVRGAFHLPFVSHAQQQAWLRWVDADFAALRAAGLQVHTAPELKDWIAHADAIEVSLAAPGAEGDAAPAFDGAWFDLSLGMAVDGVRHNILPLLPDLLAQLDVAALLAKGASAGALPEFVYLPRDEGSYLRLPTAPLAPWLLALIELLEGGHDAGGDSLRLSRSQVLRVGASLGEGVAWAGAQALRNMVAQLRGSSALPDVPVPAGLNATLRPYQQHGLNWLQFLRANHLGGLLADDMGLGKTLQALAHLLAEKNAGRLQHPALVIAPVSLMGNWQREAARFTPALKTVVWHGADRHGKAAQLEQADVIFTSYALLHRDRERWLAQPFSVVVLDEAQNIKNAATHAAQVVAELHAGQRIALSGTPLENHLGELWSLFHFLMPGFLGSHKQFTQWFRTPIEKHADTDRLAQLRRRVTPFMLRRAKSEVAADLPPKQEAITPVTLGEAQANLYETIRLATEQAVRAALADKGLARSQIEILDALLKLRQVCCDPRLVPTPSARKVKQSAKLELLMEMLPELLAEGRRVLLFSQFTSMLALIEEALAAQKISYTKLTGQTQKRDVAIARFTSGEVPLFLISLKAGGVGLNLSQADTVIHYDPWWNPAVENQATDRAHRIGQTRRVMVYKLVAEGTIEEKILALQARKAALAEGLYSEAAARKQPLFTEDDLAELLRPLDA
ncbi:DEAD/DEAH box helicase [Ottowia testudinis]|uniref:DEAD/DEAH box helicase n=1 Tax=Ottowia testudinis TaxID=2816950 RepID=A0A975H2U7_9BURK|nr:DEAD/DEAH box helicase [Ottowia testudinis]QTD45228.1 DEAD/DEAH box helicase [Ottowia testudinis]